MESVWRKSSYSGDNGGECVEVAAASAVLVRDTTDRNGTVLAFPGDAWRAFTGLLRRGPAGDPAGHPARDRRCRGTAEKMRCRRSC